MRLPTIAALFLASTALPAAAMLPPCVYDDLIADAPDAVQLTRLSFDPDGPGEMCRMEGTVVRSFRGQFTVGQRLRFSVTCDRTPVQPGPLVYFSDAELEAAEIVEVYFDAEGEIAGYGAGMDILYAPTDEPAHVPWCE